MEELLAKYAGNPVKGFVRGQKIEAKLIEISKKVAVFDIGGKSEGLLVDQYFQEARDYLRGLKPGDTVTATVMDPENSDGSVLLSLRSAASESLWRSLEKDRKEGKELTVWVKNITASGVLADYEGVAGFIPTSQLSRQLQSSDLNDLNGKSIKVKILELDKSKKKIVFSEKAISESADIKASKDALENIKEGEAYKGKITTLTDFGAFVEIKVKKTQVEGLVHVSELSWQKVGKPSDTFKVGQKVEVVVLGKKDGKLSLSIKHAQKDPWDEALKKYKIDDKFKGKVTRNSDYGVFVELEPGVEGLIHITKIPPAKKLNPGDIVNCYIEEIDKANKKISLGLVLTSKPLAYK
jgi:ribosomal protein S1